MSPKRVYENFGDKAKNCTLARDRTRFGVEKRHGPLKGCEEDCWDYEACVRLTETGPLIPSDSDKEGSK